MGTFNPEQLSLNTRQGRVETPSRHQRRHCHKGKRFLKGPIPMDWLNQAAQLPGKALHVGMAIWHVAGLKKQTVDIPLSSAILRDMDVSRSSGYRGLSALEAARLIAVSRQPGCQPRVTLLMTGGEQP